MAAQDPELGRLLGDRYRVDELIGRGGMSTVYRGFDVQLHRPVAIKMFQSDDEEDGSRWGTEVRLLSQLSHPNLVTLHDANVEPVGSTGASYLIMEYVPGNDLQRHLAEHGPSAPLAALVIAQIGEALGAVHSRGIIHRDLKPGNILIEPSDLPPLFIRAKLADFGIAHLLGSDRVTRTGTMVGTAAYTSPEQVDGHPATPASDIYSLGLVAIECIVGRPAFPGTASESLIARLTRDPTVPPTVPSEWTSFLLSMTARDPSLRPTALDVAVRSRELAPLLDDIVLSPEVPVEPEGEADPTQKMLPPTLLMPIGDSVSPAGMAQTVAFSERVEAPPRRRGPLTRRPVILGVVGLVIALIVVAAVLSALPSGSASPSSPPVPSTSPTVTVSSSSSTPTPTPTPTLTTSAPGKGNAPGKGKGKAR